MWIAHGTCLFFFFKQKTAYEMRISDWMSDVCSSDLGQHALDGRLALRDDLVRTVELEQPDGPESRRDVNVGRLAGEPRPRDAGLDDAPRGDHHPEHRQSEERRVGKECVRTCKSLWSADNLQKNTIKSIKLNQQ